MNIFLLGSCRIHRPIRAISKAGKVNLLNRSDPCWFTHTARAARQSLEIICNHTPPPLHLRELIFETDNNREIDFQAPDLVRKADILIIEICTLRSIDVEGWDANAHRMRRAKIDGDSRVSCSITKEITAKDIAEEISLISKISGKRLMIVNHISITGNQKIDYTRKKLTATLKEANKITPFAFFDTYSVLSGIPFDTALKDYNHYNTDFEFSVGNAMYPPLSA